MPAPIIVASEANDAMCPPKSPPSAGSSRLARTTIAIAFQRMYERIRSSNSALPGLGASSCTGIVLT